MRYKVRTGVFETNSSSTHSLVLPNKEFDIDQLSSILWDKQHENNDNYYEGAGVTRVSDSISYACYLNKVAELIERYENDYDEPVSIDWDEMKRDQEMTDDQIESVKNVLSFDAFYKKVSELEELRNVVHVNMDNNMHQAYVYLHNTINNASALEDANKKCQDTFGFDIYDLLPSTYWDD